MMVRISFLVCLVGLLVSCADVAVKQTPHFQLLDRDYLYDKNKWSFSGRLAVSNEQESLSLSISWDHLNTEDKIEFSGPFGQGRTLVKIDDNTVDIDYGGKQIHLIGNVDDLVSKNTGVQVPVSALKYWVLGLMKPDTGFVVDEQGFFQLGWHVQYMQMQWVGNDKLPKKMKIERSGVGGERLKLIVDSWELVGNAND
jgi:outer membrane lipoprotein LolB